MYVPVSVIDMNIIDINRRIFIKLCVGRRKNSYLVYL